MRSDAILRWAILRWSLESDRGGMVVLRQMRISRSFRYCCANRQEVMEIIDGDLLDGLSSIILNRLDS
jgi:hypothetical protein